MDAVDPRLLDQIERIAEKVEQVEGVERVRMRWVGHELHADMIIYVPSDLNLGEADEVAHSVHEALREQVPALTEVNVHIHPRLERP